MNIKDIIAPFYVWKRAFEKPYTTRKPLEERPGRPRYRGFHYNDLDECIGCGSCSRICQNEAIDMVEVPGHEPKQGDSGLRPRIDYGRCCWCALCVDICPAKSLRMTNDYIWVDSNPEVFRFIPGYLKKKWYELKDGYRRSDEYTLLNPERVKMTMMDFNESVKSFMEIVKGYSKEEAIKEADRCVECGLCVTSCPANMHIPEYIKAIREDNIEEAVRLLYKTNPFPASCGRICTHLCEENCALGKNGEAIAIRWLKRYIVDQFAFEKMKEVLKTIKADNRHKIAIIGAGPAGLSAAYFLRTLGYNITIFEQKDKCGGMLRYGIPEYRLPYNELDKDIEYIVSLGIKIKTSTKIGKDIILDNLINEYDAVFMSTGLPDPYKLGIDGEEFDGVISGVFLLDEVTMGKEVKLGDKVVVIGGGNVAMDAARTSKRYDKDVSILYRRREIDMPADDEEIHDAKEEGIKIITQAIPIKIEKSNNGRLNLTWGEAVMEDQGDGMRPKPVLDENKIHVDEVDNVISAIGQGSDTSYISKEYIDQIKFEKYKLVLSEYNQTTLPKVFAGGDMSNPTRDAISAVADGHKAAIGIDNFLQGKN